MEVKKRRREKCTRNKRKRKKKRERKKECVVDRQFEAWNVAKLIQFTEAWI